ncbi:hypothetical protein KHP62_10785 [Rhodobacteraceae bacterium NNCM2]|nr:hypothetical protein [Coraliihabitans acroporae]
MIGIIGWGSLIWDLEVLEPHVSGDWQMNAGPRLTMEFTRVSPKRKYGLAVCLDAEFGAECPTHVICSVRRDIDDAIHDLAARERTDPVNIGAVCHRSGLRKSSQPVIAEMVSAWCKQAGLSGAVWTDIGPNFHETQGQIFSVPGGVSYLRGLAGESLDEAVRYIELAPAGTDTPLRRALALEEWWLAEARRLRLR